MKRFSLIFFSMLSMLVSVTAVAGAVPGSGLYGTRHDFSGNGYMVPISGLQIGMCTICHTPHSAISTQLLWNQKLTTASYTWGDATETTGGTPLPSSANLGPSTKCLSCHDGTVAVGDGSVFGGAVSGGTVNGFPGTWVTRIGGGAFGIGHNGNMAGQHPIAIPYPLNSATGIYNGISTGSKVELTEFVPNPNSPAHSIKLYTDDGSGKVSAGTQAGRTGIECTSCHDPHNKATVDARFLRGKNAGSSQADGYICLQCHIK